MSFRSFDALTVFNIVARQMSFTKAADELHLTKGAISYQIKMLEQQLGFKLFDRSPGKIQITPKGLKLWHVSESGLGRLEQEISDLQEVRRNSITIGMTTYFASRWLSPRLMNFTSQHPEIGIRLQPTIGLYDPLLSDIDLFIRWGNGQWQDGIVENLFSCPAFATSNTNPNNYPNHDVASFVRSAVLLQDDRDSTAWNEWFAISGFGKTKNLSELIIPDPNVRVQAVIDGQGIALNDDLVTTELNRQALFKVTDHSLQDYGYFLVYHNAALQNQPLQLFRDWILEESDSYSAPKV